MVRFELILVGGGLQNALVALAVLARRPDAAVLLLEGSDRIGGNHTWSFHAGDVPAEARTFIDPLVVARWPSYDVAFPGLSRRLDEQYCAISSERLAAVVAARFRDAPAAVLRQRARVREVGPDSVTLESGDCFRGQTIVDARGPDRLAPSPAAGYQKFLGLELELAEPSRRTVPFLMDACLPQTDGFRFVYVLPLDERRVLIEDTYFSDSASLEADVIRGEVLAYAARQGFRVARILREEQGVLPLPTRAKASPPSASPLLAGYAGGWFHPATGYSFPAALRLALHIARHSDQGAHEMFGEPWTRLLREHARQFRFGAALNRLLFSAFAPEDRWNALARFYRLPACTIRRFYSLDTTLEDRLRLICGRPPRGLSLRALLSRGAFA